MCKRKYPDDWKSHIFQATSTKNNKQKPYLLEIVEFLFSDKTAPILLLCPGYFQNAYVFDLLPEKGISFARELCKNFKFHIFVLHPNGIGKSNYVKKSDLDDIAIDDIDRALQILEVTFDKPIYLMGHSMGALTSQAYFSGLSRKDSKTNVFDSDVARKRQEKIAAACFVAVNVCMTDDNPRSQLKKTSKFGKRIKFILKGIGWINACLLTRFISPVSIFKKSSIAFWKFWSFLYKIDNVSEEAKAELYRRTLDGTSAATLIQYSSGVLDECIQTLGGSQYSEGLKNITLHCCQVTFGDDPLAVPTPTKRDSFDRIGSISKRFFEIPGQGHEDFMMNPNFHKDLDAAINFLLLK